MSIFNYFYYSFNKEKYQIYNYNNQFRIIPNNNYLNFEHILNNIDNYIKDGKPLYDDEKENQDYNSTQLVLIKYNNIDYVIKRYYLKGLINYIKRSILSSRAIKSWYGTNYFMQLGFNVAKPKALLEKRWGGSMVRILLYL